MTTRDLFSARVSDSMRGMTGYTRSSLCAHLRLGILVVLLLLVNIACVAGDTVTTTYGFPHTRPSVSSETVAQSIRMQVNVSYITDPTLLYTYVFRFRPWTEQSSLYLPGNCSNRRWQEFNVNNPILWSHLWSRFELDFNLSASPASSPPILAELAISGAYLAWPTPALPWTVMLYPNLTSTTTTTTSGGVASPHTVSYRASFSIAELIECADGGEALQMHDDDPDFYHYTGTLYVVWVQPITPYLPGLPLSAEYATRSYPFPFVLRIPRRVDTTDPSVHRPSVIYSYISVFGWEPYWDEPILVGTSWSIRTWYRLHIRVLTRTPATILVTDATTTVLGYNRLLLLSTLVMGATNESFPLQFNATQSQTQCVMDSQYMCVQKWTFHSDPVSFPDSNSTILVSFNDTYTIHMLLHRCGASLETCNSEEDTEGTEASSLSPMTTDIVLSTDVFLGSITQIHPLHSFFANLTHYTNLNFSTPRNPPLSNYLAMDRLLFKHRVFLSPLPPTFFSLVIQELHLCSVVVGGYPPYLGYDTELGIERYGCSREEYIHGTLNIAASHILAISLSDNQTTEHDEHLHVFDWMLPSESAASFSLVHVAETFSSFYMQVNSILSSRPTSQSATDTKFRVMQQDGTEDDDRAQQRARFSTLTTIPYSFATVASVNPTASGTAANTNNIAEDESSAAAWILVLVYTVSAVLTVGLLAFGATWAWNKGYCTRASRSPNNANTGTNTNADGAEEDEGVTSRSVSASATVSVHGSPSLATMVDTHPDVRWSIVPTVSTVDEASVVAPATLPASTVAAAVDTATVTIVV